MDKLNEDIYNKYFNIVYKYILKIAQNESIAEEISQETFYKAIKNIHKFKGNSNIVTWLCTISKNIYYTEYNRNKKNISFSELQDNVLKNTDSLDEIVIKNEEKEQLHKEIKKLDAITQKVILLRITEELSFKEIAALLNKRENWARVTYYRGKTKIERSDYYE